MQAATCRAVCYLKSEPCSRPPRTPGRALTAGTLPCSAAQYNGSGVQSSPILTRCALIFASIDRTPSALHTAALYALFTCAKLSVSVHVELWEYLRGMNTSGSFTAMASRMEITAPQVRHGIGLCLFLLHILRVHGGLGSEEGRPPSWLLWETLGKAKWIITLGKPKFPTNQRARVSIYSVRLCNTTNDSSHQTGIEWPAAGPRDFQCPFCEPLDTTRNTAGCRSRFKVTSWLDSTLRTTTWPPPKSLPRRLPSRRPRPSSVPRAPTSPPGSPQPPPETNPSHPPPARKSNT